MTEPMRITFDAARDLFEADIVGDDPRNDADDFWLALRGAASAICEAAGLDAKVVQATTGGPGDWQTKTEPPRRMALEGDTLESIIWQLSHDIAYWSEEHGEWLYRDSQAEIEAERIRDAIAEDAAGW